MNSRRGRSNAESLSSETELMKHNLLNTRSNARRIRVFAALSAASLLSTVTLFAAPADFSVESPADGKVFKLSDAKGKFVALHFLLKTECPYCLKHTRDYAKKAASMPDVIQVFLKPDSAVDIKVWAAKANRGADVPDLPFIATRTRSSLRPSVFRAATSSTGSRFTIRRSCSSTRRAKRSFATLARTTRNGFPSSSSRRSWPS
jgi:thiol-disulfide isomerase/thioredoxin